MRSVATIYSCKHNLNSEFTNMVTVEAVKQVDIRPEDNSLKCRIVLTFLGRLFKNAEFVCIFHTLEHLKFYA